MTKPEKPVNRKRALISRHIFGYILAFFMQAAFAAKPPEPILQQMEILVRIEAAFQICFSSQEFKALSAKEALKFHDISIQIGEISEIIEKRYDDNFAYLVIKSSALQLSESPEFQRSFSKTYSRKCAPQFLTDSINTLNTVKSKINSIIKSK